MSNLRRGFLSELFRGVAFKTLTAVETDPERSHQHEFQGIASVLAMLGTDDRRKIPTRFVWLSNEEATRTEDGFTSWSNVRKGQIHKKTGKPRAPEYHLYYSSNAVTEIMRPGDIAVFALLKDETMLVVIAPAGSTMRSQLFWLFGLSEQGSLDEYRDGAQLPGDDGGFAARHILDELGIELEEDEGDGFDRLLGKFVDGFPSTAEFSALARKSLSDVDARDGADAALMAWLEREEMLFRRLEHRLVSKRLVEGFGAEGNVDVDGFLKFSLTVQNRRKSRAGLALEQHLCAIFDAFGLSYSRGAATEGKTKPDFLFPGGAQYHDPGFPVDRLTLLGSKSTCKDRWRQVLAEGARIAEKHLLTLEPAISVAQTDEMRVHRLQLVLPGGLHATYTPEQRSWLMDVTDFIELVRRRQ